MGWENVASPYVVISPVSGLIFVYSGTPGASTLRIVIAAIGGTIYGVTYPAGITVYSPNTGASGPGISFPILGSTDEVLNAYINTYVGSPGAAETHELFIHGAVMATYNDFVSMLLQSSAKNGSEGSIGTLMWTSSGGTYYYPIEWGSGGAYIIGNITAVQPGASVPTSETWHNLTPPTGWSGTLRYKALGEVNLICLDGHLTFTAYGAKGNQAFPAALPVGYRPTASINVPVAGINATALAAPSPSLTIQSNGGLEIYHGDTGTTGFDFTAIFATN